MTTDNEAVKYVFDTAMTTSMATSKIMYTKDCVDNASNVPSTECPAERGCVAMRSDAFYPVAGKEK